MVALLVRDSWGSGGLRSEWPLGPEVGSESSACECSFRLISSKGAGRAQTPSPRPAFRCSEIGKAWTGIYSEGIQVERCGLSAARWRRLRFFCPGVPRVGVTAKDNRNFVNGVPSVLRGGAQWKNLPLGTATGRASTSVSSAGTGPEPGRKSFKCCWMTRTTGT